MTRRKAVSTLRTRRPGEKPRPDDKGRWSAEDFPARLAQLNRSDSYPVNARGKRVKP